MLRKNECLKLIQFLEGFKVPYYIHAGFALYLQGFPAEVDDCDVRIYHPDLESIFEKAKLFYDCPVFLTNGENYGNGQYMFKRIEIEAETPIDICARMGTINDLGKFEFAFSKNAFSNPVIHNYHGITIPLAPPESLLLYYLVHRRTKGKKDEEKIKALMQSGKINENALQKILEENQSRAKLLKLYKIYKEKSD